MGGDPDDVAVASLGQVLAGVGVVAAAVGLAVLPVLAASGIGTGAMTGAAVGLASLAAIGGGAKAAALILGAAGFVRRHRDRVLGASG